VHRVRPHDSLGNGILANDSRGIGILANDSSFNRVRRLLRATRNTSIEFSENFQTGLCVFPFSPVLGCRFPVLSAKVGAFIAGSEEYSFVYIRTSPKIARWRLSIIIGVKI
jgi:hypothetical protein